MMPLAVAGQSQQSREYCQFLYATIGDKLF